MVNVAACAALLSGCVAADLVYLAVHATEEGFSIKYFPEVDKMVVIDPSLTTVTAMRYKRHFLREEGKCQFEGVIVPWERTWETPTQGSDAHSGTMLPPEPGKIAGYASVIYQRKCPNSLPESIFHVGIQGTGVFAKPIINSANSVGAVDILSVTAGNRPKWLPQVVERLLELAPVNATAKQTVLIAHDKLEMAFPEIALKIQAVVQ